MDKDDSEHMDQKKMTFNSSLLAAYLAGLYAFLKSSIATLDKEHIENAANNTKAINIFLDKVSNIKKFSAILDKPIHYHRAVDLIIEAISDDGFLSESLLFATLDSLMQELNEIDRLAIYDFIVAIVVMDKKVDKKEHEFLVQMADHFHIEKDVSEVIDQCQIFTSRRKEKFLAGMLVVVMLMIGGWFTYRYLYPNPPKTHFGKLVFDRVLFSRYVIASNFNHGEKDKHVGKAVVYFVTGSADVQFDFEHLSLRNCSRMISNLGKISLMNCDAVFTSKYLLAKQKASPYEIVVKIDNSTEAMRVNPQPISDEEAKKLAITAGLIAGAGGAYVGAKVGAQSGGAIGNIVGKFAGVLPNPVSKVVSFVSGPLGSIALGGIGAVIAGGALGATGYVVTKNMVGGIHLTSAIGEKDRMNIMEVARRLTAATLIMDTDLNKRYVKDFESSIHKLYKPYGVEIRSISYE